MDPISVISGPVSPFDRADVDTDQIMPKQFVKRVEGAGFGEFLFYDWAEELEWDLPANMVLSNGLDDIALTIEQSAEIAEFEREREHTGRTAVPTTAL